ncbi:hypothetical protein Ddc_15705 [Ditylenchus destructor]|nr:hypothetical protein Ddc_15705 [Ditylenchus destructor]
MRNAIHGETSGFVAWIRFCFAAKSEVDADYSENPGFSQGDTAGFAARIIASEVQSTALAEPYRWTPYTPGSLRRNLICHPGKTQDFRILPRHNFASLLSQGSGQDNFDPRRKIRTLAMTPQQTESYPTVPHSPGSER